jgi:lipoate-protein ligase A
MEFLEQTFETVAENVAFDVAMLAGGREAARVWECGAGAVVLGRSGRVEDDVREEACFADGVAVVRRESGGGTVWVGPGCVNYALVLSLEARPELGDVGVSMRRLLGAVIGALGVEGLGVAGSDVVLGNRKVSGCAQRRVRGWVLHHGTVLCREAELGLIARYLKEPPAQPEHRGGRSHLDFVTRLPMGAAEAAAALRELPRLL